VLSFARQETKDGLELHFGVCHIGHFLLTNMLLGQMGSGAHIVVISSSAHKIGKLDFNDLSMNRGYSVIKAYSRAKLCNMLFVSELARRLNGKGMTVSGIHPGAVASNIGAKRTEGMKGIGFVRRAAGRLLSFFVKTPGQAAKEITYIAVNETYTEFSGGYFAGCKLAKASAASRDEMLGKQLWEASISITMADI
jgi:NAD(P)-dependent dehydrogenase (short-subunit alcohol dehydrogenase family)